MSRFLRAWVVKGSLFWLSIYIFYGRSSYGWCRPVFLTAEAMALVLIISAETVGIYSQSFQGFLEPEECQYAGLGLLIQVVIRTR